MDPCPSLHPFEMYIYLIQIPACGDLGHLLCMSSCPPVVVFCLSSAPCLFSIHCSASYLPLVVSIWVPDSLAVRLNYPFSRSGSLTWLYLLDPVRLYSRSLLGSSFHQLLEAKHFEWHVARSHSAKLWFTHYLQAWTTHKAGSGLSVASLTTWWRGPKHTYICWLEASLDLTPNLTIYVNRLVKYWMPEGEPINLTYIVIDTTKISNRQELYSTRLNTIT